MLLPAMWYLHAGTASTLVENQFAFERRMKAVSYSVVAIFEGTDAECHID